MQQHSAIQKLLLTSLSLVALVSCTPEPDNYYIADVFGIRFGEALEQCQARTGTNCKSEVPSPSQLYKNYSINVSDNGQGIINHIEARTVLANERDCLARLESEKSRLRNNHPQMIVKDESQHSIWLSTYGASELTANIRQYIYLRCADFISGGEVELMVSYGSSDQ